MKPGQSILYSTTILYDAYIYIICVYIIYFICIYFIYIKIHIICIYIYIYIYIYILYIIYILHNMQRVIPNCATAFVPFRDAIHH